MSEQWGYENDEQTEYNNGPKALRDAYESMKQQNKELQDGLASIQRELREQKLRSTFESLGVPQAQSLYQGEADPDKAAEWVNSMKSVFGGGAGVTPPADSMPAAPAPAMSQDQQAQFQRMTEAGQAGAPLGNVDAAFAAVGDANDVQSLIAAFKRAQGM